MTYAQPCNVWVAEAYPCRWTLGSEGTHGKSKVEPQHAPCRRGNTSIKQHLFEFGVRIVGLEISSGIQQEFMGILHLVNLVLPCFRGMRQYGRVVSSIGLVWYSIRVP